MTNRKILSRLDLGRLQLRHRVVLSARQGADAIQAYGWLATRGGLVVSPPLAWRSPDGSGRGASAEPGASMHSIAMGADEIAGWHVALATVHSRGAYLLARLQCPDGADEEGLVAAEGQAGPDYVAFCNTLLKLGFDAVEICGPDIPPIFPSQWLHSVIELWGSDRVGFRLSAAKAFGDARSHEVLRAYLSSLNEIEPAFLHLEDCGTADVALSGSGMTQAARSLRSAFHGSMIVSGNFSPEEAVLLVESRWADAVCLSYESGDGPGLLARLAAAC